MTNPNLNQDESNNEVKLYAGKFKTVEDLENGYKNAATVYDENSNLKKKVDELSAVPDVYQNPSDITFDANRITDYQTRAREAGLTQTQYDKFLRNEKARLDRSQQNFENARKEIGEETLNLLNDYVSKHYPKQLQQGVLNTLITNKDARQDALNHRQQLLNNRMPGMEKAGVPDYYVSDEDVRKAYAQKEKTKSSKDINAYMRLVEAQASQKARTAS